MVRCQAEDGGGVGMERPLVVVLKGAWLKLDVYLTTR